MAVDNTRYGIGFITPAIPYQPNEYDQQAFIQLNNVLRLYFLQVDTALRNATISDRAEATSWFLN